uniref:apolipoprotein(a)-like n=1 Tax=Myxine glutinosa TaxID=7769 RepID=UPI00358E3519
MFGETNVNLFILVISCLFSLQSSVEATTCYTCNGETYRGNVSVTLSGKKCQHWDSQVPHRHDFKPSIKNGLQENVCRNPNGEPFPWCFTMDPNTKWEFCKIPKCKKKDPMVDNSKITYDCVRGVGSNYRGKLAITMSGWTCQHWNSQHPHKHDRTPQNYTCKSLESNFCRNPGGETSPWCITTNPDVFWEACSLPLCQDNIEARTFEEPPIHPRIIPTYGCIHCNGMNYRGTMMKTKSGILCQHWDSQTHHKHNYTPQKFPLGDLRENFCRNPGGDPKPWCYTAAKSIRWEYCDIPQCEGEPPTPDDLTYSCVNGDGSGYRGQVSMTRYGKTCQAWDSPIPHQHVRKSADYSCFDLQSNYCRNPGGADTVWCYTMDSRKTWDTCAVPACTKKNQPEIPANKLDSENCFSCNGEDYRGEFSHTTSGRACQRWDSQHPHKHDRTMERFPESGLSENFCRNPEGEAKPWCYTTDRDKRWEFCPITRCAKVPATPDPSTFTSDCVHGDGSTYRGEVSVTISGKNCKPWSKQAQHVFGRTPENYPCKDLIFNYCRNPGGAGSVWCYTTDMGNEWELCKVPACKKQEKESMHSLVPNWDCYTCRGADYRGHLRQSEFGKPCQRWDSHMPNEHTRTAQRYPKSDLRENFCRNPDNELRPWCYTKSPFQRWEYCDVPPCKDKPPLIEFTMNCTRGMGTTYRGQVSTTLSGQTCQRWDDQYPHEHDRTAERYPCKGLESNFCRNPDGEQKPWCYTTNHGVRWQACSIPTCS